LDLDEFLIIFIFRGAVLEMGGSGKIPNYEGDSALAPFCKGAKTMVS
jgi:hypothetical protein